MLNPRQPVFRNPIDQPAISKIICTFLDCVAQGDSGANRALTNDRTLLTNFTPIISFPIGTSIGPKPIMTTHRGIMQLPIIEGRNKGFTMYYSKDSSDSVISLDRHVIESNGRLQWWIQWGDTDSGNGSIIFLDTNLQKVATLKMYGTNGLWYARVGNGIAPIDTNQTPSIWTAASDMHSGDHDYTPSPKPDHVDTEMINVVLKTTILLR